MSYAGGSGGPVPPPPATKTRPNRMMKHIVKSVMRKNRGKKRSKSLFHSRTKKEGSDSQQVRTEEWWTGRSGYGCLDVEEWYLMSSFPTTITIILL